MSDRQRTLADEGFERYRKPTRREQFVEEMERIIPWAELTAVIEPFYPAGKGAGRPPIGIERLSLTEGGLVRLALKTLYRDGTTLWPALPRWCRRVSPGVLPDDSRLQFGRCRGK